MYQRKIIIALLFFFSLSLIPSASVNAKMYSDLSMGQKIYWITGSTILSPVYWPFKIIYSGGGIVTSGLVFLGTAGFASDTAVSLAKRSIGGDWYIHPDYLLGNRKLRLFEPVAPVIPSIAPVPEAAPAPAPQAPPVE